MKSACVQTAKSSNLTTRESRKQRPKQNVLSFTRANRAVEVGQSADADFSNITNARGRFQAAWHSMRSDPQDHTATKAFAKEQLASSYCSFPPRPKVQSQYEHLYHGSLVRKGSVVLRFLWTVSDLGSSAKRFFAKVISRQLVRLLN